MKFPCKKMKVLPRVEIFIFIHRISFSCMIMSFSCLEISFSCMKMTSMHGNLIFSWMKITFPCHDFFIHETFSAIRNTRYQAPL